MNAGNRNAHAPNKAYENLFADGKNVIVFGEEPEPVQSNPLESLKAIILSIEWEINDAILEEYLRETELLSTRYSDDQVVKYFLKMLNSAGSYIRARMEDAHPETLRLLISIYDSFEKVFLDRHLSEAERKHILKDAINRFSELKDKIRLAREEAEKRSLVNDERIARRQLRSEAPPRAEAPDTLRQQDADDAEPVGVQAVVAANPFEAAINAALNEAARATPLTPPLSPNPVLPAQPGPDGQGRTSGLDDLSPEARAIAQAVAEEIKRHLTREFALLRQDLAALSTGPYTPGKK